MMIEKVMIQLGQKDLNTKLYRNFEKFEKESVPI